MGFRMDSMPWDGFWHGFHAVALILAWISCHGMDFGMTSMPWHEFWHGFHAGIMDFGMNYVPYHGSWYGFHAIAWIPCRAIHEDY